jgi:uncharacterized membrane protein YsdA (DUF1294 family)
MAEILVFLREYGWIMYLIFISSLAFVVTVYDKIASKKLPEHRTRESSLLIISALGGSLVMLLTMHLIRHKTKHLKFMIGIPVIILLQALTVLILLHLGVL